MIRESLMTWEDETSGPANDKKPPSNNNQDDQALLMTKSRCMIDCSRAEFVMAHLCMQPDFNGNTVVHLAAQSSSLDVLRQINPVCVRNSLYIFNDEGLNTFLIACRYGTLKFMRYFVEHGLGDDACLVGKLMRDSRDQANIKNCLHYACGRGCGKSCLQVVGYLTRLAGSLLLSTDSSVNYN